ncbi:glycosyltransferase [Phormidium tenue FACHB-886]|nr:glycosyltransferase [Phormidium tenue FACHB-886]
MTASISLLLSVYNRDRYIAQAIESVLRQTHRDFELILWDDGSTDGSLDIAQSYAQRDDRIQLISAPHQGRARSLVGAHALAQGEYVGWVDSDDLLLPSALAETIAHFNTHPNIGMVYSDYEVIDEHNQLKGLGKRCRIPYSPQRLLVDFMTFHFRLMRRSVYEQVGGVDSSFPCAMDYDLCLKLSEVTEIRHLARPLYRYRSHCQSISQGQRHEQIDCAARAVRNALRRRGLSDRLELEVKPPSRFCLRQKAERSNPDVLSRSPLF